MDFLNLARQALTHCQALASFTDESGTITRTFLSEAARSCHQYVLGWMDTLGMQTQLDAVGNLRGLYPGRSDSAKRLMLGSHLDTVPNAGAYDGILGVVIALALLDSLGGERLPFAIEVIAFSEEEGVRFGFPFIGSQALAGTLTEERLGITDRAGVSVRQAIEAFGLDPSRLPAAGWTSAAGAYVEFHIEQGPVLEALNLPLAVVTGIVGQSRAVVTFSGKANHAGTTPMNMRQDALCAAAEWITSVEKYADGTQGLVATVGRIEAKPGATNVVPGEVTASLDVRHPSDDVRKSALNRIRESGSTIAQRRGLGFQFEVLVDQAAVPMDEKLTAQLEHAIQATGITPHRMTSGAGHDAMVLAPKLPSGMIFIRSPGGVSHHPDETVEVEDVAAALHSGFQLLHQLKTCPYLT